MIVTNKSTVSGKKKRYPLSFLRATQFFKNGSLVLNFTSLLLLWAVLYFCPAWVKGILVIYTNILLGFIICTLFGGLPDVYRHFKTGELYEELLAKEVIIFEEDGTQLVVYRPFFKKGYRNIWARRYNIFHELVLPVNDKPTDKKVCRFRRIL